MIGISGVHIEQEKCSELKGVKAGKYKVEITWFAVRVHLFCSFNVSDRIEQGSATFGIRATYSGPDTFGTKRFLGSAEKWAPPLERESKWQAKIFSYTGQRDKIPDFQDNSIKLVDTGVLPFIDFSKSSDLSKVCKVCCL